MRRIRIALRRCARRLLGLRDTPRSIALGAALGTAIALGPTYGLQIVLAIGLAALLRANKAAALLPTFLVNPITGPPVLFLQYLLGRTILGGGSAEDLARVRALAEALGDVRLTDLRLTARRALSAAGETGWAVLAPVMLGMAVTATACALLAYPAVYRSVVWFRRRRHQRHQARRHPGAPPADPKRE